MKKALVIVVTFNGLHWLERCLGSVYADADLYVFDNDSTDGSADFVAAHFPQAKLVRSAENLGFSKPNNLGFDYALKHGYDYVYLLNQDAWIEPTTLGTLIAVSEAHPEYAVLSPMQMTDGFEELDRQFGKLLTMGVALRFTHRRATSPTAVRRVMAAHWLIPRKSLETIGLFSDLFPIYGNDDNWCDRARFHGFKIGIIHEARAVHDRAYREEPKEKVIFRNYYMGSLVRLCDINRPLWERFLFVCLFTFVKAVKYRSILPFKHFRSLVRMLPAIRKARLDFRPVHS